MRENGNNNNYLSVRRKHFLWGAFALVLFGAILYFANIAGDYAEKNDIETLEDVKENVAGILKHDFAIFRKTTLPKRKKRR